MSGQGEVEGDPACDGSRPTQDRDSGTPRSVLQALSHTVVRSQRIQSACIGRFRGPTADECIALVADGTLVLCECDGTRRAALPLPGPVMDTAAISISRDKVVERGCKDNWRLFNADCLAGFSMAWTSLCAPDSPLSFLVTKTMQDGIAVLILPTTLWLLEYHSVNEKCAARLDLDHGCGRDLCNCF